MRSALLIGFEYKNYKKLPGILVDLYQVYSFLKKIGWLDTQIYVFTDIQTDEATHVLKTAILEKTVDSNILSFIQDIKKKGQHILFTEYNHQNNFISRLSKFKDNLFLYFSGHSEGEYFVLPNENLVSIKNIIKCKQLLVILDCCEGGLNLPFLLNKDNIYRLQNEIFIKPEILCIASSAKSEKSTISKSGSSFTKHLFNIINDSGLSMKEILNRINQMVKETANVSTTYPNIHYINAWFYSNTQINIKHHPNFIEINL